jgi:hypothetical protein
MSKKINISIPNKVKPNLINLFHEYLVRKAKEPKRKRGLGGSDERYIWDTDEYEDMVEYWDRMFPGWDDDDDGDVVYPSNNVIVLNPKKDKDKRTVYDAFWTQESREEGWGKKGKKKHKKGKKARLFDINVPYSGEEEEIDFDFTCDDYGNDKEIWFYVDYHDKEDRLEFNSLKDFIDYCDSMGYYIPPQVERDIEWRYESHCCLCPDSEKIGFLEVMSGHSYGDMFFSACEDSELNEQ